MTQLLVSVRSVEEALTALDGGADVIDIKEPANGSLGRADDATVQAIVRAIAGRRPVSAALGEWVDGACELNEPKLTYVKWGLMGCLAISGWRSVLEMRLRQLDLPHLVLVAYADWQCAQAPSVDEVLDLACANSGTTMLIDTHCKTGADGRRPTLLDWLSFADTKRVCDAARESGVRVALAGSLGSAEIVALASLRPDWFAVRGAVCGDGDRTNAIECQKVISLKQLILANAP